MSSAKKSSCRAGFDPAMSSPGHERASKMRRVVRVPSPHRAATDAAAAAAAAPVPVSLLLDMVPEMWWSVAEFLTAREARTVMCTCARLAKFLRRLASRALVRRIHDLLCRLGIQGTDAAQSLPISPHALLMGDALWFALAESHRPVFPACASVYELSREVGFDDEYAQRMHAVSPFVENNMPRAVQQRLHRARGAWKVRSVALACDEVGVAEVEAWLRARNWHLQHTTLPLSEGESNIWVPSPCASSTTSIKVIACNISELFIRPTTPLQRRVVSTIGALVNYFDGRVVTVVNPLEVLANTSECAVRSNVGHDWHDDEVSDLILWRDRGIEVASACEHCTKGLFWTDPPSPH